MCPTALHQVCLRLLPGDGVEIAPKFCVLPTGLQVCPLHRFMAMAWRFLGSSLKCAPLKQFCALELLSR